MVAVLVSGCRTGSGADRLVLLQRRAVGRQRRFEK